MNKVSKTTSKCHYCRVLVPPFELDECKQSKTLPLTIGFRSTVYKKLNTTHIHISRPGTLPHHVPYRFGVCPQLYRSPPAAPPLQFPLVAVLGGQCCVEWQPLVRLAPVYHFLMKRPAASTTPRYQFPSS